MTPYIASSISEKQLMLNLLERAQDIAEKDGRNWWAVISMLRCCIESNSDFDASDLAQWLEVIRAQP